MSYTFTHAELASDIGTQTADGLRNAANQAANFVCSLYQNSPAWLLGSIVPGNPGQAFASGLMGRLCAPRGIVPAPNNSNFSGGQCNALYNFSTGTLNYQTNGNPDSNGENIRNFTNIQGPLLGFRQDVGSVTTLGVTYTTYSPKFLYTGGVLTLAAPSYNKPSIVRVFNIVRVGGADNCGDPAPLQPVSVNPTITNVTNNANVLNVGAVTINAPITFIPTFIANTAEFRPVFNVRVGPFDVKFDLGGIQVSPNFNISGNFNFPIGTDPRPTPPTPYNPNTDKKLPPSGVDPECDLTGINTKLDDIKECSCPVNYSVSTTTLGSGVAGYAALPSNCIKVSLSLTSIPTNAKRQKSNGSEPDSLFCGYYYWGDGTGRTERIAISKAQSVFFPPNWATAFGWDLYLGYNCSVVATNLVPAKTPSQLAPVQMKKGPS